MGHLILGYIDMPNCKFPVVRGTQLCYLCLNTTTVLILKADSLSYDFVPRYSALSRVTLQKASILLNTPTRSL